MPDVVSQFHDVWPQVKEAPWAFVALGIALLAIGWIAGRFMFSERIAILKSRIEARDETIADLRQSAVRSDIVSAKIQPLQIEKKNDTPRILKSSTGSATNQKIGSELSLQEILVRNQWTFHFSPTDGRFKNMTFLRDGEIGEGRNKNEFRWVIENERLVIYRQNGDVQNVFRRDEETGIFVYATDSRSKGFKNQLIERR